MAVFTWPKKAGSVFRLYAMSPVFRGPDELLPEDLLAFGTGDRYWSQDPVSLYKNNLGKQEIPAMWKTAEIGREDAFLTSSDRTRNFLQSLQSG